MERQPRTGLTLEPLIPASFLILCVLLQARGVSCTVWEGLMPCSPLTGLLLLCWWLCPSSCLHRQLLCWLAGLDHTLPNSNNDRHVRWNGLACVVWLALMLVLLWGSWGAVGYFPGGSVGTYWHFMLRVSILFSLSLFGLLSVCLPSLSLSFRGSSSLRTLEL